MNNTPFFILGCVRSGTTLLRDVLRLTPRLASPEETHFFRHGEPFGTQRYTNSNYDKTLTLHRQMDNVSETTFSELMATSQSRKELMDRYMDAFLSGQAPGAERWYDKTPQNVYGIFLLAHYYPESKFLHIHRDPRNVVSSLTEGKVMPKMPVIAGINYWNESMILIDQFQKLYPDRIYEIKYEHFIENHVQMIAKLLEFLDEDPDSIDGSLVRMTPERNRYRELLSREDVSLIEQECATFMRKYGYL